MLTLNVPISGKKKKITEIFIFTLLCGASKGFMKALKARQSSVKIKLIFISVELSEMHRKGRVNIEQHNSTKTFDIVSFN